jgi:SulP family sulfate permease
MRYVDELTEAIRSQLALAIGLKDQLGFGLRSRLREGYTKADLKADVLAGVAVGAVAVPLSMALAVAISPTGTEVPPQHGLYAAIIAGIVCALLGGTRVQVTGPTAAFVVILAPIVREFGLAGLMVAGLMAGAILVLLGVARLGKLMTFIPHPVATGFTSGIAVVLVLLQLRDLLGIQLGAAAADAEGTLGYLDALWAARSTINGWEVAVGAVTIGLLLGLPRVVKRVPAPLIALVGVTGVVWILAHTVTGFEVATIGSRFGTVIDGEAVRGIPPLPPLPVLPWDVAGGTGFRLDWATLRALLPSAFAIALLGAMESLTAAVIADGMSGSRHDPNSELIALGIANIVCPFFGGIAVTGALARTATNIRAGARSPLAAVFQGVFILACTMALGRLLALLPMAALAGLLVVVARNLAEARHFVRLLRIAPRSDVMVLLTCFTLTVVFDMVIAVTAGIMLAALLFMRRMAVLSRVSLDTAAQAAYDTPKEIRVYEIAGPMFFGAAKTAMETLDTVGSEARTVILSMKAVPVIDATGMVALETILDRLHRSHRQVILAALQPQPADLLERAGIRRVPGRLAFAPDVETAISMALVHHARAQSEGGDGGPHAAAAAS